MVSDYLIVRRSKLRLSHLYMPTPNSIYYFTYGINFRALAAWTFGVWPLMRKLRLFRALSLSILTRNSRLRRRCVSDFEGPRDRMDSML